MRWIKLWPDEWLNGTLRFTLDHKKRAVWADVLCLAGRSRIPGVICAGEENGKLIGYPPEHLAGITLVTPEEFLQILSIFEAQGRVNIERENGRIIIHLTNWKKYQSDYYRQKPYRQVKRTGLHQKLQPKLQAKVEKGYSIEVEGEGEGEEEKKNPLSEAGASDPVSPTPKAKLPSETGLRLARLLREHILENNPKAKITPAQETNWAREADLMLKRDNRTEQEVRDLIEWSQQDSFWQGNILSMGKLREKFDQLTVKRSQVQRQERKDGPSEIGLTFRHST
jgi:hypothetical protein